VTRAGEVLIATEGYTDGLLPALQRRVIAVGSYIIVTEPLSRSEQEQFSPKQCLFSTTLNLMNYFRLTHDGRVLFGGRNDLRADQDRTTSRMQLSSRFEQLFPELRHRAIEYSWGGRLGFTFDRMPHVGRTDGVYYSVGYCGHGVPTAIWCGQAAADLIMGRDLASPVSKLNHPTMPFYGGRPWFLPLLSYWYRFVDHAFP
jgi:glycine/D-amino acid oxidase-like deaminating enzyme